MAHLALRFPDKDLIPVLRGASSEDLEILVGFILKASTSELELVPEFKRLEGFKLSVVTRVLALFH
jgi:hypothetical protein